MRLFKNFLAWFTVILLTSSLYGGTLIWDPAQNGGLVGGNGDWTTSTHWWNGVSDVSWATGSDTVFGNSGVNGVGGTVTMSVNITNNSLTFSNFTGTYTIGSSTKTNTINKGVTNNVGSGPVVFNGPVTMTANANPTWDIRSTNPITLNYGLAGSQNGSWSVSAGTVILQANNSITFGTGVNGLIFLNGGTIKLMGGMGGAFSSTVVGLRFSGISGSAGGTFIYDNTGATGSISQIMGALSQSTLGLSRIILSRNANFPMFLTLSNYAAPTVTGATHFVCTNGTLGTDIGINFITPPSTGTFLNKNAFFNYTNYVAYDAGGWVRGFSPSDATAASVSGTSPLNANGSTTNYFLTGDITSQASCAANTINMGPYNIYLTGTLTNDGFISYGNTNAVVSGGAFRALSASGGSVFINVVGVNDMLTFNTGQGTVGAQTFNKVGLGTFQISSNFLNTSPVNVNEGAVLYNYSGNPAATNAANNLNICNGAKLGGSGTIYGPLTFYPFSYLQPSVSLSTTNNLTLGNNNIGYAYPTYYKPKFINTGNDRVTFIGGSVTNDLTKVILTIDASALTKNVTGALIMTNVNSKTIYGWDGSTNKFYAVTADSGFTATVHYNNDSITVDLTNPKYSSSSRNFFMILSKTRM